MGLFYENYCTPQGAQRLARNYPVVCVNYHKIWDNPAALVRALGLPGEEAEKVRDGVSGAGSLLLELVDETPRGRDVAFVREATTPVLEQRRVGADCARELSIVSHTPLTSNPGSGLSASRVRMLVSSAR